MGENKYILAMYDIRGKQEYIYSNPKIKQIAGASWVIRDCFKDYLFPVAESISGKGIFNYKSEQNADFSKESFERHLEEGYIGEVIYDGGGNFLVLFKDKDNYVQVNKKFYVELLRDTYTLRVLSSYIEGINFADYIGDEKKLRDKHKMSEQRESTAYPINALPIVQTDNYSSLPLTDMFRLPEEKKPSKVSRESYAKYAKYKSMEENGEINKYAKNLDKLVEEKGVDSHLAVIYIDGNGMGAKVQKIKEGHRDYQNAVRELRKFSQKIEEEYISKPKEVIIKDILKDANRFVVSAGDEITLICNAKYALRVVKEYFETIQKQDKENTSCAGIAIFHSHAPFAEAYRIAEECCETGKTFMKKHNINRACFMDFHYCQGAIGTSLEDIREHEGTEDFCIPWLLSERDESVDNVPNEETVNVPDEETIDEIKNLLNAISRSNGKTLLQAAKDSEAACRLELERIIAHCGKQDNRESLINKKEFLISNRKLLYRMMLVYDLWFKEEGKADAQ